MSGSPSVAEIILREFHPIKMNQLNSQNKTGLFYLIGKKSKNIINILNILLNNGLDINFKPEDGNSILTDFVLDLKPDLKVIEFLLQNGADSRILTTQNKSLYEIIEDSVENQIFYVQSQRKVKIQIFELFQKYKIIENDENEENNNTENNNNVENEENNNTENDENNNNAENN